MYTYVYMYLVKNELLLRFLGGEPKSALALQAELRHRVQEEPRVVPVYQDLVSGARLRGWDSGRSQSCFPCRGIEYHLRGTRA